MNATELLSMKILTKAIQRNATDIHFYPLGTKTDIYFRIQGKRLLFDTISNSQYDLILTYYKFTSGMDIGEIRKPQNGTIPFHKNSDHFSLRLSTLPVNHSESLAIRILPQNQLLTLNQLFLFRNQIAKIRKWMKYKSGLILLSGPTGSGKTTTLYALLEEFIKEGSYQTITLEDPIEKNIQDILQVQVNEKAGITYQSGLKAALRHDPDIIMVGEIRDRNTAHFALEASLTGHLVLSTIHAKDAAGTIHRLYEMGLNTVELSQSLISVASIELLPIDTNHERGIRRAAILEILDEDLLEAVIHNQLSPTKNKHSFDHLRRKAYCYGYISKSTYENLQ